MMPDSVTGRSKSHENQTCFTSSFIALYNITSQFGNLLGSRATSSKPTLLGQQLGSKAGASRITGAEFEISLGVRNS